ncbi:MAG: alpha/beta hydrolase [Lachnospiraceae bacterium]|nr:alpha/beta hydrolase [Lachnospiraceae bacterium]
MYTKTVCQGGFLYRTDREESPLVVLIIHEGDGWEIVEEVSKKGVFCNFYVLCPKNWNKAMTPWPAKGVFKSGEDFAGNAEEYLNELLNDKLPYVFESLGERPESVGLVGYSLAGLFALYAVSKTDVFDKTASVSGSLWYKGFTEYLKEKGLWNKDMKIYLSVGDREDKSADSLVRTVSAKTDEATLILKEQGHRVTLERNEGNHFHDVTGRIAKAVTNLYKTGERG